MSGRPQVWRNFLSRETNTGAVQRPKEEHFKQRELKFEGRLLHVFPQMLIRV